MIFPHQGIVSLNYTPFEVSRCYESHCPIDSLRGGGPCPRSPSKPAQEMGCALEVTPESAPNHHAGPAERGEGTSGRGGRGAGRVLQAVATLLRDRAGPGGSARAALHPGRGPDAGHTLGRRWTPVLAQRPAPGRHASGGPRGTRRSPAPRRLARVRAGGPARGHAPSQRSAGGGEP